MRTGQRVIANDPWATTHGTIVDFPTEERTRVLFDGRTTPVVVENAVVDDIPTAVEAIITRLLRILAETTEDERPQVTTQLRRLTGHGDLVAFARSLRSGS